MKLLLTSTGLFNKKISDFLLKILPKRPEDCSVFVFGLMDHPGMIKYQKMTTDNLKEKGFKDITFFNLKDPIKKFVVPKGKKVDLIFAMGGETFHILERVQKIGFKKIIKKMVKDSAIYLGASAGSILAGKKIDIAAWGSEADENDIGLKDTNGLNLTNIAIFPHFRKSLKKEVDEFRKKVKYPVVEITDKQAVFVDDEGYKIIE
jgi:peptidase E